MANKGIHQSGGRITANNLAVGKGASIEVKNFYKEESFSDKGQKKPEESSGNRDSGIFFSYAWGIERESFIDGLYKYLKEEGFNVIRDKMDLGYKGLISDFMSKIGTGRIVIVAITDKYLKSEYCMYELYELFRNCRFEKQQLIKRMFPVKVENINLARPTVISSYINYWINLEREWESLITNTSTRISEEQHIRYRRIKKIATELGSLLDLLSDMNLLTIEQLSQNDFLKIVSAIKLSLKEDA